MVSPGTAENAVYRKSSPGSVDGRVSDSKRDVEPTLCTDMPSAAIKSRDGESVPDIQKEIECAELSGLESDEELGDAAQVLKEVNGKA